RHGVLTIRVVPQLGVPGLRLANRNVPLVTSRGAHRQRRAGNRSSISSLNAHPSRAARYSGGKRRPVELTERRAVFKAVVKLTRSGSSCRYPAARVIRSDRAW